MLFGSVTAQFIRKKYPSSQMLHDTKYIYVIEINNKKKLINAIKK